MHDSLIPQSIGNINNPPFLSLISIIIPTYQREDSLITTLQDLLAQNYPHFEVLVIDQTQHHAPQTQSYLEELAQQGKISWFQVQWASLPGARNYGVRRSQGEIILFIDDDVKIPPDYLVAHSRNYQRPEVGAVAGRVWDRLKLSATGDWQETKLAVTKTGIDYLPPQAMDAAIAWYYLDLVYPNQPQQVISARGCNMSFRRQVFTEYGLRFDERFQGSAVREESDFCLRIRSTPWQIWYDPEAYLIHWGEETGGCHDLNTRSFKYQLTFYHNHFLMGFNNLTPRQQLRLFTKLFDCHVLGHPPCYKSGSPLKVLSRGVFYFLGLTQAIFTKIKAAWDDGQVYSRQYP